MIGRQGVFLCCAMNKACGAVTPSLRDGLMSLHFPGISCLASAPWKRTSQQLKGLHC